jgi:hypothetical protein
MRKKRTHSRPSKQKRRKHVADLVIYMTMRNCFPEVQRRAIISGGTTMTTLLQEAIDAMAKLPPDDQDAIATLILQELADEQRWQENFASSPDALAKLAEEAKQAIRSGKVRNVGFDEL